MKALAYTKRMIGFNSVSHRSNRTICKYLELKLAKYGFVVERLEYVDPNGIRKQNLVAKKGAGAGGLGYFGHTDTVPARRWHCQSSGPFDPVVRDGRLYGRGSCDMKGSLGCILAAVQRVPDDQLVRPVYLCFTADEEIGYHGIKQVVAESKFYREMVEYQTSAIVGEPTMLDVVYAHKGTCLISASATGRAAHSSTVEGRNANWAMIPFLNEAYQIREETESDPRWQNDLFAPPSLSMNLLIEDRNRAINITSPQTTCSIYLRPMTGISVQPIVDRLQKVAQRHDLDFAFEIRGEPFIVDRNSTFVKNALEWTGSDEPLTVCYGTDGGYLTELENKIVLGPGSIQQAHTEDEFIELDQLNRGVDIYARFIRQCCTE